MVRRAMHTRAHATGLAWRQNRCCLGDTKRLSTSRQPSPYYTSLTSLISSYFIYSYRQDQYGADRRHSPRASASSLHVLDHSYCISSKHCRDRSIDSLSAQTMGSPRCHSILLCLHPIGVDCRRSLHQPAIHEEAQQDPEVSKLSDI